MARLFEAIEIKRKTFFEFEAAPYVCLDVDVSKPTDPYRTLMWNLKRYTVAEVSSTAVTVSAQDLINQPAAWRGQLVGKPRRLPK